MDQSMRENSMSVTTRPIKPDDEAFLLDVYASTRIEELSVVPWNDAQREAFLKLQFKAQQDFYLMKFPYADLRVIMLDQTPVGRLYLAKGEGEIRILDISLLLAYRNRGIGTPLIKELMAEAEASGRPVRIYVESFSPALHLFERLGFTQIGEYGASFQMEWNSDKSGQEVADSTG